MSDYFALQGYLLVFVVLGLVMVGGVLLLLRPLYLWYFKIYSIESALKENNALLREIRDELREQNSLRSSSRFSATRQEESNQSVSPQPKEEYSKYMPR